MFGSSPFDEQQLPSPSFGPAPWANHHKFNGGVPLPSPPWETVPLRRNGGGHKNNKGPKSRWFKVDGGLVASDGQVVQHVGGNHRYEHQHRLPPVPFGSVDPCNLIVRVSEYPISRLTYRASTPTLARPT
jgi:hypothetical protein